MPSLRFFRGADLLLEHRLRSGRTVVGRADTCDVALPGDEVSREHAVITHRGERTELQDKSRHGTWVNGERVSDTANLDDGAVITTGAYRVEVALSRADWATSCWSAAKTARCRSSGPCWWWSRAIAKGGGSRSRIRG